ncbi:polycomb group protein Psc [Drosophila biarmipes]|uniref:polycomb group protein Psc n=1 Tax=Drosophila biarmipes TaxID=125945 RepID=UPI0007E63427|nr:polycomb group protein Psc [Drosophila biarmipes]
MMTPESKAISPAAAKTTKAAEAAAAATTTMAQTQQKSQLSTLAKATTTEAAATTTTKVAKSVVSNANSNGNSSGKKLALSQKAATATATATAAATTAAATTNDKMQKQQQLKQQLFAACSIKVKSENTLATTTAAATTLATGKAAKTILENSIKKESTPPGAESLENAAASSSSSSSSSSTSSSSCSWSTTRRAPSEDASSNGGASADEEKTEEDQQAAASSTATTTSDLATTSRPRPVLLTAVNPHIICHLCQGYLINATTIVECLHSFCHSCLINHLRKERFCPRCEMVINNAKPNIKSDTTLQAIVYKLVPGLYERELMRKRAFYKDRPQEAALATPEQRGDDTEHLIFSPSDDMSLSLEYAELGELKADSESELVDTLRPRYLQCPAMCRVSHLKKFVYDKFEIDAQRFSIDIMYKVKTIVLLDYYTLMDIAYIYTWKRDAPMRFYYRVYESPQPLVKPAPRRVLPLKLEKEDKENQEQQQLAVEAAAPQKAELAPLPEVQASIKVEQQEAIKEIVKEVVKEATTAPPSPTTEPLKLVINRNMLEKRDKSHSPQTSSKLSSKNSPPTPVSSPSEPNIKLKIDLSKQNSVTIINMSDPERREIVKPLKPEKESRSKKKDKDGSPKSSSSSSSASSAERKRKSPSPLTVPPLTIRTERIMSPNGVSTLSPRVTSGAFSEDPKSEFLKSFALKPIKVKVESPERMINSRAITPPSGASQQLPSPKSKGNLDDSMLMKPPSCMPPKSIASSKRKSKDPVKAVSKKPKLSPPLPTVDFKIRLPATNGNPPASATPKIEKPLMPPPPKPPMLAPRKMSTSSQFATPPSPMHHHGGVQMSAPGNRTPIAKRYQPILPKASRPNPFANIPNDVNRLLKDAGTEIKSIGGGSGENTTQKSHVYGPKSDTKMGPPPPPAISANGTAALQGNRSLGKQGSNSPMSGPNKSNSANNYLNLALFNSSKSKGKEAPPGCRTPMYTPNSPIYSPSSPQYVPSYNIPTMPTYKYTPKPTANAGTGSGGAASYLQNMLGGGSGGSLGGLFPSPPTKSDQNTNPAQGGPSAGGNGNSNGNLYLPNEDAPEKQQVKVKSLLNSCNINIPSSLSITISRDNGDPSSPSNGQHPKHKSPVNNYIEIVKLPDQPQDQAQAAKEAQKRQSPPVVAPGPLPAKLPPPPPSKAIPSPQHLISRMTPPQLPQVTTPPPPSAPRVISPPKTSPPANVAKGTPLKAVLTPTQGDKKTPSPEKRTAAQMGSHSPTASENKSPKGGAAGGANAGAASQNGDPAAKKFRPILPRQNAMPELAPKLPTLAPPFGFNPPQNPATAKKVPPSKKSPNAAATGHQQPGQQKLANGGPQQQAPQKPSPPQKNLQQGKKVAKNPTPPPPSLPGMGKMLPHPVMHGQNAPLSIASSASAAAVASGKLDLTNFIKENLMRVQAAQAAQAAAAANQSNMMYNFAQMGHMSPAMYGYQQAYLMEQLSRMQRAGNEVFNDYLQKLQSAAATGGTGAGGPAEAELKPMLPTVTLPSPGATPPAASPKTSPLPVGKLAAAATAPQTKGNSSSSGASARPQTAATGTSGATASAASLPPATKSK